MSVIILGKQVTGPYKNGTYTVDGEDMTSICYDLCVARGRWLGPDEYIYDGKIRQRKRVMGRSVRGPYKNGNYTVGGTPMTGICYNLCVARGRWLGPDEYIYNGKIRKKMMVLGKWVQGPNNGNSYVVDGKVISAARLLLSMEIGRWLRNDEYVTYRDSDPSNLDVGNLLVSRRKPSMYMKEKQFTCPMCSEKFAVSGKALSNIRYGTDKAGPFCTRRCAGKHAAMVKLHGVGYPPRGDVKVERGVR